MLLLTSIPITGSTPLSATPQGKHSSPRCVAATRSRSRLLICDLRPPACAKQFLATCLITSTVLHCHLQTTASLAHALPPRAPQIPAGTVNALTLVFVLSAIAPDTMAAAVRHCAATLAPGGRILASTLPPAPILALSHIVTHPILHRSAQCLRNLSVCCACLASL